MRYAKTKKADFQVNYSDILSEILTKKGTVSTCFNMFHNYSINNQFLLYWQLHCRGKEVSPCNSYDRWKKLGRQVRAKESGMYLWRPISKTSKVKDSATGEEKTVSTLVGFKFMKGAFSFDQTDPIQGKDYKATDFKIPNFDFNKVYDFYGIKLVPFEKVNGNIQGYANTKERTLAINPVAEEPEMTILHEIAHIALKHFEVDYGNDLKELEAEAVAYIVGSVLGLSEENLSHSRGYIQGWFKGNEVPEQHAKNIMSKAQKILELGMGKANIKGE